MSTSLVVLLERARGLAAKDRNGLSDPYVQLSVECGVEKAAEGVQKSSIQYKTLSPQWKEYFFFTLPSGTIDCTLTITVWDYDRLSKDDFMGTHRLLLDLSSLSMAPRWLPVSSDKEHQKDVVSGEIKVCLGAICGSCEVVEKGLRLRSALAKDKEGSGKGKKAIFTTSPSSSTGPLSDELLQKLEERGEKLNAVNEKSAKLEDDASEMASLAGELKTKLEAKSNKFCF